MIHIKILNRGKLSSKQCQSLSILYLALLQEMCLDEYFRTGQAVIVFIIPAITTIRIIFLILFIVYFFLLRSFLGINLLFLIIQKSKGPIFSVIMSLPYI